MGEFNADFGEEFVDDVDSETGFRVCEDGYVPGLGAVYWVVLSMLKCQGNFDFENFAKLGHFRLLLY